MNFTRINRPQQLKKHKESILKIYKNTGMKYVINPT
jgi:hypothetical protein